jgi:hypothetical protein
VGHIHYSPRLKRTPAATEAMYLMMKKAFESGYRRYEWKCDALNAASRAAAERLGLSFEGVFRQAAVYKGRNRDTAWYAAIDAEWPALREAFVAWLDPNNFDAKGQQRARLSDLTRPILKRRGRSVRLVDEVFAEAFQGFAGVVGDVGVFGVGEVVEIGPEKSQAFAGNHLHRVVNPLRILARQGKAEAVQGLSLAEAG